MCVVRRISLHHRLFLLRATDRHCSAPNSSCEPWWFDVKRRLPCTKYDGTHGREVAEVLLFSLHLVLVSYHIHFSFATLDTITYHTHAVIVNDLRCITTRAGPSPVHSNFSPDRKLVIIIYVTWSYGIRSYFNKRAYLCNVQPHMVIPK